MNPFEAQGMSRLDVQHGEFRRLLDTVRYHVAHGRREIAAVYGQVAAQYAWFNHTGLFASPELEGMLSTLLADQGTAKDMPASAATSARILHVVTQVYQTGGPTQAIACWIEHDFERHHKVCITRQGTAPVPQKLTARLNPSDLVVLDSKPGGILGRARTLQAIAQDADVVVVHSHPHDVLPVIAFAEQFRRPPVIYVNHGDHVFWIGVSVANLVVSMRNSGERLAIERRGVEPSRSMVLERPLRLARRQISRERAKETLRVSQEQVLVVTTADSPKYRAVNSPSLLKMVLPVFENHKNALLWAAGPLPEGEWADAEERTAGRIKALGLLPDVTLLHQAADVYLDSFPFSSLTSLIEAGSLGVPLVTFAGHPPSCAVLGADTAGLDCHMRRPTVEAELRSELDRLVTDASWRRQLGDSVHRAISETHAPDTWRRNVALAYAASISLNAPPVMGDADRDTGTLDVLVDRIMAETGYSQGMSGSISGNLSLLPIRLRLQHWWNLRQEGVAQSPRWLLPDWIVVNAARLRRRLYTSPNASRERRIQEGSG